MKALTILLASITLAAQTPPDWDGAYSSTLPQSPVFRLRRLGRHVVVHLQSEVVSILETSADPQQLTGTWRFPQTDSCAPEGLPVTLAILERDANRANILELRLPSSGPCLLRLHPDGAPLDHVRLSLNSPPARDHWESPSFPGRKFAFSVDEAHIYVREGGQLLGSLAVSRSKRNAGSTRYEGQLRLPPATGCPAGLGWAFVKSADISANHIRIRIESPEKNKTSGERECPGPMFGSAFASRIGPLVEFIRVEP